MTTTSQTLARWDDLLRKKADTILLASSVLFECAQKGYLHNGRGAVFFLFANEYALRHDADDTQYTYVQLNALLEVAHADLCKLVEEYNPRTSFVLLLAAKVLPGGDSAPLKLYSALVNPECVKQLQGQMMQNIVSKLAVSIEAHNTDVHFCASTSCSKTGKLRCARCQDMWYCSAECQLEDWRYHKPRCVKK